MIWRIVLPAVLAVAGAAVGLLLAWVGLKALTGGLGTGLPASGAIGLDGRVRASGPRSDVSPYLPLGVFAR